jgi:hypothetical protein
MPSTVIRSFAYDPATHELRVVFQSGHPYTYRGVPEQTYAALKAAVSKGEYFNAHIRDRFVFIKAGPDGR